MKLLLGLASEILFLGGWGEEETVPAASKVESYERESHETDSLVEVEVKEILSSVPPSRLGLKQG